MQGLGAAQMVAGARQGARVIMVMATMRFADGMVLRQGRALSGNGSG